MKTLTKKIKVNKKWAKEVQKHIDENKPLDENVSTNGNLEKCLSAHFGTPGELNQEGMDVDINIYDSPDGPWIDAILIENSCEVTMLEPQYILLGKYPFEYDGNKYVVIIN